MSLHLCRIVKNIKDIFTVKRTYETTIHVLQTIQNRA